MQQVLLSPAELSYLHTSLSLQPPIRPDARLSSQFRRLIAETDILPGTNGSARICFADGTEAIVGIKAEVQKSRATYAVSKEDLITDAGDDDEGDEEGAREKKGLNEWVELMVEIPGFRDEDSMPVFLGALLTEALLADGEITERLWINRRFHWKLYLDVCFFSSLSLLVSANYEWNIDSVTFSAIVLPTTTSFPHNTSSPPCNPSSKTQI